MTTIYHVTAEFAASVLEVKNPWFIVNEDYVVDVYVGRAAARAAKATGLAGKVVSAKEIELKTIVVKVDPTVKTPIENKKGRNVLAAIKPPKNTSGERNRSNVEKPVTICWNLFDEMKGGRRKDSIAAAVAKGVTFYTAHSQYQLWFQVQKEMKAREEAAAAKVKK